MEAACLSMAIFPMYNLLSAKDGYPAVNSAVLISAKKSPRVTWRLAERLCEALDVRWRYTFHSCEHSIFTHLQQILQARSARMRICKIHDDQTTMLLFSCTGEVKQNTWIQIIYRSTCSILPKITRMDMSAPRHCHRWSLSTSP